MKNYLLRTPTNLIECNWSNEIKKKNESICKPHSDSMPIKQLELIT